MTSHDAAVNVFDSHQVYAWLIPAVTHRVNW